MWESQFRLLNSSGGVFNDSAWRVTWSGYCSGSGDGDGSCAGPNRDFTVASGQTTYDSAEAYATVTSVIDPAITQTYSIPAAIAPHDACTLSTPPWASLSPTTSVSGQNIGISWGASHFNGCSGAITYYVSWHNSVTGSGLLGITTGTSMTNDPSPANSYQYYTIEAEGDGLTSGAATTNTDHVVAPPSPVNPPFDFAKVTIGCNTASNPGGLYITGSTQTGSTVKCTGSYPTKFPKGALGFNMYVDVGSNSLSGVTATWETLSGSGSVMAGSKPCLYGDTVSGSYIYCDTTQGNDEVLTLKTPAGTKTYTFYIGPMTSTYR